MSSNLKLAEARNRGGRIGGIIVAVMIAAIVAPFVHAQQTSRPALEGVWVEPRHSPRDPRVRLEDVLCRGCCCPIAALEYAVELLQDPRNDHLLVEDLNRKVRDYSKNFIADLFTASALEVAADFDPEADPVLKCIPTGFNFAPGPLPIKIEQYEDEVLLRYEFWHSTRIVHMDGREHPKDLALSRLGHSIGWYDGDTLVVETTGIEPHLTYWADGTESSDRAWAIERFTRSADGQHLEIEKTIIDPVMLRRPLTTRDSRLYAPDVELLDEPQCEAFFGER